jgi:uncharacterized membrane protein
MGTNVAPTLQTRKRSQKKLIFFAVFFAVTAFVTYGKNAQILDPASAIARHFAPGILFLIPHAIFATLAFMMGAFQFSNRLRAKYLKLHRTLGYVYVTSVMVGAPLAIPLAMKIGTPSLVAATFAQSVGWMGCTVIALYCIRNGNIKEHRKWMMRGYPFAMVFTAARVIFPFPPVMRMGRTGTEIVVWSAIFAAAFFPSLIMEWQAIKARPAAPKSMAAAAGD